jgi:hypothetical protein
MDEFKYFLRIDKTTNKVVELIMNPIKPNYEGLENFVEIIEVTLQTFCELAYGSEEVSA